MENINKVSLKNIKAFTLIEMVITIIVVAVISVLALNGFNIAKEKSISGEAVRILDSVRVSKNIYKQENKGAEPTSVEQLDMSIPESNNFLTPVLSGGVGYIEAISGGEAMMAHKDGKYTMYIGATGDLACNSDTDICVKMGYKTELAALPSSTTIAPETTLAPTTLPSVTFPPHTLPADTMGPPETFLPPGGPCFLPDVLVTMGDGTTKQIKDVVRGDKVLSYDTKTKTFQTKKVRKVVVHDDEVTYVIINDNIKVTPNHPVLANGKWKKVGKLENSDILLSNKGEDVKIISIEKPNEKVNITYNLIVKSYHTYVAGGIVVHNGSVGGEEGVDNTDK